MNQERLNEIEKPLLHLVERDVVPALGCTEPISLALAAATAAKYLGKTPERIEAQGVTKLNEKWFRCCGAWNGHGRLTYCRSDWCFRR